MVVYVMPDHLHMVLRAARRLPRPLGHAIRGFKGGVAALAGRTGLFAPGFVDNILFDDQAVAAAVAYVRDNPRRLAEKRAHPELFRVVRDLAVPLSFAPAESSAGTAHFMAIGNRHLLAAPLRVQVQCSRADFAWRRDAQGRLLKDEPPAVCSPAFLAKREALLEAGRKGAVLVSPCISHGEKALARLASEAGLRVVALQNKGFPPLFKPSGKAFDRCAAGSLLLLAPAAWPWLPGEKPITRADACALNRLAQALAGSGAAEIRYRGAEPARIDEMARAAVRWRPADDSAGATR